MEQTTYTRNLSDSQIVYAPNVVLTAKPQFVHDFSLSQRVRSRLGKADLVEAIENRSQDKGTDAERLAEFAARGCYDSYTVGRPSGAFHRNIMKVRHGSVLEHAHWTFWIEGVSRGLTHELVRHRVGIAISQRSTRYADEDECRMIMPPMFIIQPDDDEDTAETKLEAQRTLLENHRRNCSVYKLLVESGQGIAVGLGQKQHSARKTARGAARSALPNGMETVLTWTFNLRSFINMTMQRYNQFAEWEIRRLFALLFEEMKKQAPAYLGDVELEDLGAFGKAIDPTTLWSL